MLLPFLSLALFSAVEHGHLDKARTILESTDVDVNRFVTLPIALKLTPLLMYMEKSKA